MERFPLAVARIFHLSSVQVKMDIYPRLETPYLLIIPLQMYVLRLAIRTRIVIRIIQELTIPHIQFLFQ